MLKRFFIKTLALTALFSVSFNALAVSDSEMEEARAIAAKFYIRYINNGAGYLDNWLPKSLSDLEKKLTNNTDRDNLKKFRSVSTPTDYASWDKDKLAAYWGEEFFAENAGALDQKAAGNGMCRKQIKQAVGRMQIAAPETPAVQSLEPEVTSQNTESPEDSISRELAQVDGEIQEAQDMVEQEAMLPVRNESSGTWVYIMVLALLVGVVIFLVVYASKTMKGQQKQNSEENDRKEREAREEDVPVPVAAQPQSVAEPVRTSVADDSRMREKYAQALASKAEEIRALNRQLAEMEAHASKLKEENRSLIAEIERLKRSASFAPPRREETPEHRKVEEGIKEVYLGRVNSKGLFVRADRHAVDGQSIYKLTTTNGHTGTYTLIHNPLIEEQALEDPGKWLAGGCFAKDIFDTEGRQGIRTETPGTAVFRDGAWRVERKAKIRYC